MFHYLNQLVVGKSVESLAANARSFPQKVEKTKTEQKGEKILNWAVNKLPETQLNEY